ncbi:hypothetical protein Unana1_04490 [Umbelopsis nana]
MSSTQEPVAEPTAAPETPIETPVASEAAPTEAAAPEQQTETKEPTKVVKRKSIFNPFGRKKEETKKEEQTEAKSDAENAPESKPAAEETTEKRKPKGFNMLFSRAKSASPQPNKTEEQVPEATNTELPKIEHLEPIQPEAIVNQVTTDEAAKAVDEGKTPIRSSSPFGKRFTNIFKFSKSNDKAEKEQQVKEEEPAAGATATEEQEPTATESAEKPLPQVTATPDETDKPLAAPQVTASA